MNKKDIFLDLICMIELNPQYSQRDLSKEIGASLGKINYCIKQLKDKGLVKITNFKKNPKKIGYAYLVTPKGINEKTRLTFSFLQRKIKEYELLKEEIKKLQTDARQI